MDFFALDDLCLMLQNATQNRSLVSTTAATTLAPQTTTEWIEYSYIFEGDPGNGTDEAQLLERIAWFEDTIEWYGMLPIAVFGILANIAALVILAQDKEIRTTSKVLIQSLVFFDFMYLVFSTYFITIPFDQGTTITMFLSILQSFSLFASSWLVFLVGKDCYRSMMWYWKPGKIQYIGRVSCQLITVVIASLVFQLPVIPHLRVLLHAVENRFNPCINPTSQVWEYDPFEGDYSDIVNWVYFKILYILIVFIYPYFFVAFILKDTLDVLQRFQEMDISNLPDVIIHNCITGLYVIAILITYIFLLTMKTVFEGLQFVDLVFKLMSPAFHVFKYVSVLSNLLVIIKMASHFPILLIFNRRIKRRLPEILCAKCRIKEYDYLAENKHAKIDDNSSENLSVV